MKLLNKINATAYQKFFLTGNPGSRIAMELRYLASQQKWIMNLQQDDFVANGIGVVGSPNILRCFKNVIPFGIACKTVDGLDPFFIDSFSTGAAQLYLLTAEEVQTIEDRLFL